MLGFLLPDCPPRPAVSVHLVVVVVVATLGAVAAVGDVGGSSPSRCCLRTELASCA